MHTNAVRAWDGEALQPVQKKVPWIFRSLSFLSMVRQPYNINAETALGIKQQKTHA